MIGDRACRGPQGVTALAWAPDQPIAVAADVGGRLTAVHGRTLQSKVSAIASAGISALAAEYRGGRGRLAVGYEPRLRQE